MIAFSVCKVNLGLWIESKREDSYHNMQSVFLPVNLNDSVEIQKKPVADIKVYNADFDIPKEQNLLWKTYILFKEKFNIDPVQINLVKNIPSGGGIGGGSGNVGCFINLLDRYFQLELSLDEKQNLALEIGSDCPYFINPVPSVVWGRGEKVKPISNFPKLYLVLLFSNVQISTKEAYSGISPKKRGVDISEGLNRPKDEWTHFFDNDFSRVVYNKYPELVLNLDGLNELGAFYSSLSGTGGCQFALFNEEVDAKATLGEKVIYQGWLEV